MTVQVCNGIKHYRFEKIFKALTKQILYVCVHIHEIYIHMCIHMGFHNGYTGKETVCRTVLISGLENLLE